MKQIITFLTRDIWRIPLKGVPFFKAWWIRLLRIALLTRQVFIKAQLQQGASTLTYYTLLALVPVLVILLGVTRGFMQEKVLVEFLIERFSNQKEVIGQLIVFADAALEELKHGWIAGIGILVLLWSAIKILFHLEISLNTVWNVKKGRPIVRKFSDYLAMILFSPLLFLVANGLIFYLSTKIGTFKKEGFFFQEVGLFLFFLYNILPYFLTSFLFTFIYMFMPNTRVRFIPALYGGLIAGALYQIIQWIYLVFQINVTRYNAVYGTFAAFPLFLIWVHLSWLILLLGGKIAYAFQNVDAYEFVTEDFSLSHQFKTILSLRIAYLCIQNYCGEKPPPTEGEISNILSIPLILNRQLLSSMVEVGILSEVKRDEDEMGFAPALPLDTLTIKRIIDMIDRRGETIPLPPSREVEVIIKTLDEFKNLIERANANIPLKDI
jgi:membrane protein